MYGVTVPTDGGGGATDTGFTKGGTVSARPLRGEWWGPQDPWAVLQARDIGPCEVAFNGGYCRGSNSLNHLVQSAGGVGFGGIYHARVRGARGQALRCAGPKYPWRKRWCVVIMFRSMEYKREYLPSVSSSPAGVRAGATIQA